MDEKSTETSIPQEHRVENGAVNGSCSHNGEEDAQAGDPANSKTEGEEQQSSRRMTFTQGLVLAGAWLSLFTVNGVLRAYGILYLDFLSTLHAQPGETSWIASAYSLSQVICSPILGVLYDRVNNRLLICGAVLVGSAGFISSSFVNSVQALIFTYGCLTGISRGAIYMGVVSFVNKHFNKYPMLANGVMFTGSSIGGVVFPFLISALVHQYALRGALLLLGAIWLHQLFCGLLFSKSMVQTPKKTKSEKSQDTEIVIVVAASKTSEKMGTAENTSNSKASNTTHELVTSNSKVSDTTHELITSNSKASDTTHELVGENNMSYVYDDHVAASHKTSIPPPQEEINTSVNSCSSQRDKDSVPSVVSNAGQLSSFSDIISNDIPSEECKTCLQKILKFISSSPFFKAKFVTLCFFMLTVTGAFQGIVQYMPAFAEEAGMDSVQRATVVAIMNAGDLLSRCIVAVIGDRIKLDKGLQLSCSLLVCAGNALWVTFSVNQPTVYIYSAIFGMSCQLTLVFLGVLVRESVGPANMATGLGVATTFYGIGGMLASLTFGYIRELTGTYKYTFILSGIVQLTGIFVFCFFGGRLSCKKFERKSYDIDTAVEERDVNR